jgi:hypothetical protein
MGLMHIGCAFSRLVAKPPSCKLNTEVLHEQRLRNWRDQGEDVIFGTTSVSRSAGVGLLHGTVINRRVSAARHRSVKSLSCFNAT